jgi:hypothetical protein
MFSNISETVDITPFFSKIIIFFSRDTVYYMRMNVPCRVTFIRPSGLPHCENEPNFLYIRGPFICTYVTERKNSHSGISDISLRWDKAGWSGLRMLGWRFRFCQVLLVIVCLSFHHR